MSSITDFLSCNFHRWEKSTLKSDTNTLKINILPDLSVLNSQQRSMFNKEYKTECFVWNQTECQVLINLQMDET